MLEEILHHLEVTPPKTQQENDGINDGIFLPSVRLKCLNPYQNGILVYPGSWKYIHHDWYVGYILIQLAT